MEFETEDAVRLAYVSYRVQAFTIDHAPATWHQRHSSCRLICDFARLFLSDALPKPLARSREPKSLLYADELKSSLESCILK